MTVVVASLAAALALISPAVAGAAGSGPPFAEGDRIAGDWVVTSIERHPEYVRLSLEKAGGASRTVVEVTDRLGSDEWSTRYYRVQPAPGASPPEPVLADVLRRVKAAEEEQGYQPLTQMLAGDAIGGIVFTGAVLLLLAAVAFHLVRRIPQAGALSAPLSRGLFLPWRTLADPAAAFLSPAGGTAWTRLDWLLAAAAAAAAYALLALPGSPVPLGLDTVADFARARDCVEGPCRLEGPVSSLGDLRHGAAWILLLSACKHLGLGVAAVQQLAMALHAAAAGVLYLLAARLFGRRAGVLAALAGAGLAASLAQLPMLWTPTPAPLPLALWMLGRSSSSTPADALGALRRRRARPLVRFAHRQPAPLPPLRRDPRGGRALAHGGGSGRHRRRRGGHARRLARLARHQPAAAGRSGSAVARGRSGAGGLGRGASGPPAAPRGPLTRRPHPARRLPLVAAGAPRPPVRRDHPVLLLAGARPRGGRARSGRPDAPGRVRRGGVRRSPRTELGFVDRLRLGAGPVRPRFRVPPVDGRPGRNLEPARRGDDCGRPFRPGLLVRRHR